MIAPPEMPQDVFGRVQTAIGLPDALAAYATRCTRGFSGESGGGK